LFDVTTKNPEGLAGTYVDLWAANPNRDDDLCRLDFEGGEVVKDHNGCEYFEVSRLYRNAKKKNGMLCRWSTETAPRPMDREGVFSARLDVFTLTAPWPWERAKDDPFHVSFAFIDNRVKKGMSPEQIVEDIEEKWRKDRKNRERESVELASNS
jgi:hypothetical protein